MTSSTKFLLNISRFDETWSNKLIYPNDWMKRILATAGQISDLHIYLNFNMNWNKWITIEYKTCSSTKFMLNICQFKNNMVKCVDLYKRFDKYKRWQPLTGFQTFISITISTWIETNELPLNIKHVLQQSSCWIFANLKITWSNVLIYINVSINTNDGNRWPDFKPSYLSQFQQ